jgi:proline racemase
MVLFSSERFSVLGNPIVTLDYHVGGEPIRLIVEGLPEIAGDTINDKRLFIRDHLDDIRLMLTREPRGHRDMFAGIITDPVTAGSRFGIVFMDARRYPYMCGHGMIGAVTAFVEMECLDAQGGETQLVVDSPAGPVKAEVRLTEKAGQTLGVESVAIQLESAFAFLLDQALDVPELGRITVDVCFAGGFFVMVSVDELGTSLSAENASALARWGMAIIEAANQQLEVRHPTRTYINTVDVVEFYDPRGHRDGMGKNIVVLGEGHVDRSPCGTGTAAKLALLHRRGLLSAGQPFVNQGILETRFEGRIVAESTLGDLPVIIPEIRGSAHATGLHHFVVTPDDPLPRGFLI